MAEDIIEFRAWARESRQKSWKELDAERKAQELARVQFEEENKVFLSKCQPFSWVEFYKAQPEPAQAPIDYDAETKETTEDPSSMMEYLGLQESDFFYG